MLASRACRLRPIKLSSTTPFLRPTAYNNFKPMYAIRPITCSTKLYKEDKRTPRVAERALESHDDHHGSFSRTDNTVFIEHPDEANYPRERPYDGHGGMHFKRTLQSFTLDDKVAVVTGGARGLGLVMSQACLLSGANVAIVDLNSKYLGKACNWSWLTVGLEDEGERQAKAMVDHFMAENPGVDESVSKCPNC